MNIAFSPECREKLRKIKQENQPLFKKIVKQLKLFEQHPTHPSLRLHKLKGNLQETWSISITMAVRMVFYYRIVITTKQAVFFNIGTHEEVYR